MTLSFPRKKTKLILKSCLLKHQLNQLPSNNIHASFTPLIGGHFGEAPSIRLHIGPTAQQESSYIRLHFHSTTFGPPFKCTAHVGSTPLMGLNASTPPLGAYATAPLEALDPTPPGISP